MNKIMMILAAAVFSTNAMAGTFYGRYCGTEDTVNSLQGPRYIAAEDLKNSELVKTLTGIFAQLSLEGNGTRNVDPAQVTKLPPVATSYGILIAEKFPEKSPEGKDCVCVITGGVAAMTGLGTKKPYQIARVARRYQSQCHQD